MRRARLACLLLLCAGAASPACAAPKPLDAPPLLEGVKRPLPRSYDMSPALRLDGKIDCRAWTIKVSAIATPRPERYDGCAVIRRETADPFGSPARGGARVV